MHIDQKMFEIFLPKGVFEWFDMTEGEIENERVYLTLVERNEPPVHTDDLDKMKFVKFRDITITDFPIRGRRAMLTFRRRYWKKEGEEKYIKRDMKLSFPGTKLEEEFAIFLKEDGGRSSGLAKHYRDVSVSLEKGV